VGGFAGFSSNRYEPTFGGISLEGHGTGGGLSVAGTPTHLGNSILAENWADDGPDGKGVILSEGYNLIGSETGMTVSGQSATDLTNIAPRLGSLQDNGGWTPTHALLTTSPAIDAGSGAGTPTFDQRGVSRPQGVASDIGAFERITRETGGPLAIAEISPDRAVLVGCDVRLSVAVTGSPPVALEWTHNDRPIDGATNATLDLLKVQLGDSGSYRFASAGMATSAEAILEVKPFLVDPTFEWLVTSQGHDPYIAGIVVDPVGNLWVAGDFKYRIQFGDTVLTNNWNTDLFLLKYGPRGDLVWALRAGGTDFDVVNGMGADAAGNLYLTGGFYQTTVFGGARAASAGGMDVFVAKVTPGGVPVWLRRAGGSGHDQVEAIAVDASGNCIVTGSYSSSNAVFGTRTLDQPSGIDVFVAKYDSQGAVQWARRAGGPNPDYGNRVAIDEQGNCYVSGVFNGTAVFDPGVMLSSTNENAPFVASYDPDGQLRWVKPLPGRAIATDQQGHFYLASGLQISKFDSNGTLEWTHAIAHVDPGAWAAVIGLAVDSEGSCYAAGYFYADLCADNQQPGAEPVLRNAGVADLLVAKIGVDGRLRWLIGGGGNRYDYGDVVAFDGLGQVYVGGTFERHATFGALRVHGSSEDRSIFLTKLVVRPRLGFLRAEPVAAGNPAGLFLEGEAGVRYLIDHSEDLSQWSALITVTNSAGLSEILDPSGSGSDRRFYRARVEP
jgi:hypothetical protein